jgi:hypothetical protein
VSERNAERVSRNLLSVTASGATKQTYTSLKNRMESLQQKAMSLFCYWELESASGGHSSKSWVEQFKQKGDVLDKDAGSFQ